MESQCSWTREEIRSLYTGPLLDLVFRAASVHRRHHASREIQICSLISLKTGGCPEDCKYCPQSARYQTDVRASPLLREEEVLELAKRAAVEGASRICLGAAWRSMRSPRAFASVLRIVRKVADLGVEVCCTLGMLNPSQARQLKEAGLYAYNHNLDTSPEFYPSIITTRSYEERLNTLDAAAQAGLSVCCGGILGMGESEEDRIGLLQVLASRNPHPGSVPLNFLIPVAGTPLERQPAVPIWEMMRMVASARILMPRAMIRLSAGRLGRSLEEQALCFLAGANSIFSGETLLTRPNPDWEADAKMLSLFGLRPRSFS